MVCLFIDRLNLGYGQCLLFLPDCFSVREAVEKMTGGNMRREMYFSRFARVKCLAVFVYKRNSANFLYNCDGNDA